VLIAVLCLGLASSGCSLPYLSQAVAGHLDLLHRARPLDDWLADAGTPAALRERLTLARQMRDFAVRELKLPDGASYRRYAVLDRPAVVWNVVAAPELSLTLKTWCVPVVGCVGYRGWFDRANADALVAELQAEGWETHIVAVPAYSTLGRTDWLGGDPLLSTFIGWPEGELARLLFHEMAHQVVFVEGDTAFNESFATAVERLGVRRWLAREGPRARGAEAAWEAMESRRRDFRALTTAARAELQALYDDAQPQRDKLARKAAILERLRADHARLKADRWGGFAGYDAWFARVNNAMLAIQASYDAGVPAFERLFEAEGRDFARFFAAVRELAAGPAEARAAFLRTGSS
jgi:predicted aminopeptidase